MIDIRRNAREILRIRRRRFNGYDFVDVRVFYPGPNGELQGTKKGVTVSLEQIPDFTAAVKKVAAQTQIDERDAG